VASRDNEDGRLRVARSLTILRDPAEVYRAWREPQSLSRFLDRAGSIEALSGPARPSEERDGAALVWRVEAAAGGGHEATVTFTPVRGGTRVDLVASGGGRARSAIENSIARTLYRCRQWLETGEVATNEGPSGGARWTTGVGPKLALVGTAAGIAAGWAWRRIAHAGAAAREGTAALGAEAGTAGVNR